MQNRFEARWASRERADLLKRTGRLGEALVLDTFNGFIVVQPRGSNLADGKMLSADEADYELQPVWFLGPIAKLREARRRLGLEVEQPVSSGA
jgi:hypothetical protein